MASILSFNNQKVKELGKSLGARSASFDLLAGYTCPYANICRSMVLVDSAGNRHIKDYGLFRCYAVKAELAYTNTYNQRKANTQLTRQDEFVDVVCNEIQRQKVSFQRIHSAGDFYTLSYYSDWRIIASYLPDVMFFGYSKNPYAVHDSIVNPAFNFKLVYSHGGTRDSMAEKWNLPTAYVVTPDMELKFDNPIACEDDLVDDYMFILSQVSFGIKLH